jgi:propionyl-CoA carboxylase alpha chain
LFKKILIANRGEIACRIIRTCQKMGIRTVALYSEADSQALHVDMADECYPIGASPAPQSYLKSQAIIDVARLSGAEAIHPGYGFLSENADFAAAVESAGITFIGPRAEVIRLLGDKLQAKMIACQANVPMVPGSEMPISTREEVKTLAARLGYPLLLKAAAGGGGKGMRVIHDESQIDDYLQRTTHEALSGFGDGRIFVEKFLDSPRHIEVQVLADTHGNIVHLGERDCSLQRRHQKVMEESPSPFVTPPLRDAITRQAIALARQAGYTSAGTVEFMVTPDQNFYFLEMNTRLQVEHTVTEMVTGLDLVEHMIRIAAGEPLPFTQNQIIFSGHAIEARIYSEDVDRDFMPCSGRITRFESPPCHDGLRLDTGVEAGAEVSIFYDPMIAKLISWAPNRQEAIKSLRQALAQFIIEGATHNLGFLERLLHHPKVTQGDFSTSFIEKEMPSPLSHKQKQLAKAIATLIYEQDNGISPPSQWIIVEGKEATLAITGKNAVVLDEEKCELDLYWQPRMRQFTVIAQGESHYGQVTVNLMNLTLTLWGTSLTFQIMRPKIWELYRHMKPSSSLLDNLVVKAPMAGVLVSVDVSVGDPVKQGQTLLVVEAMKMENALKSPIDGTVTHIFTHVGDAVTRNQTLVKLAEKTLMKA